MAQITLRSTLAISFLSIVGLHSAGFGKASPTYPMALVDSVAAVAVFPNPGLRRNLRLIDAFPNVERAMRLYWPNFLPSTCGFVIVDIITRAST